MGQGLKIMLWTCFVLWLYIHGLWLIFLDTLFSSFPLLLFGSLSLFIAYYYMKLPPPDESFVEDLLGRDPWLEGDDFRLPNGDAVSDSNDGNDSIERREPFCMRIIAHRGAGLDAPENSLSAFRKCKERGCTAVEFDVALTADGVPVIFHDKFVDRVTDSTGLLSSKTLEEVKRLDISAKHPFRDWYNGERVPTLEEAVKECLSLGLKMFIDLKDNDTKLLPHILALFGIEIKIHGNESGSSSTSSIWKPPEGTDMHSKAVVTTFHANLIYLIRRADPRIVCTLAWRPFAFSSESYSASASLGLAGVCGSLRRRYPDMLSNLGARIADEVFGWCINRAIPYYFLGLSALLVHKDLLSPELLRQWRQRGVRIIAWTVNNPPEKQFFAKILKVSYITDTLDAESDRILPPDLAATR